MIYVDVTQLVRYFERGKKPSGIQRVTWECAKGLLSRLGKESVMLFRLDKTTRRLMATQGDSINILSEQDHQPDQSVNWHEVGFNSSDMILLTESLSDAAIYKAIKEAKLKFGFSIYQIIYDVIPLARPDLCPRDVTILFEKSIGKALQIADKILVISEHTLSDLNHYCSDNLAPNTTLHILKLPHEFSVKRPGQTTKKLPKGVKDNFVLVTGTIEDRKNQHLVWAAWRKLSRKHFDKLPQLVLVGKFGKLSRLNIRMRYFLIWNSWLSNKVMVFNRCSDDELRQLYDNCLISIYVSDYEGWGLPVGESLWCGRPVLSGISTSLPEVGGDLVDYVDPHDERAMLAAIEKLCFDTQHRESRVTQIANAKLRTWDEAIEEMVGYLREV